MTQPGYFGGREQLGFNSTGGRLIQSSETVNWAVKSPATYTTVSHLDQT